MEDIAIPDEITEGLLGHRFEWLLQHVREGGHKWSDDEIEANFALQWVRIDLAREALSRVYNSLPGAVLVGIRRAAPHVIFAVLEHDGRTWDVGLSVEATPPHRIRNLSRAERAPGVVLRTAVDADAAVLRAIELEVPVVSGDTSVVYDRGADYFEAERLMGDAVTHVVELNGRPVGLTSWVLHPVRVKGATILGGFKHKMRLLKDARGLGARQMLDFAGFEIHASRRDVFYTYSAVGNDNVHHIYGEAGWAVYPERLVIETKRNAGSAVGRPATVADSDRIVRLLNRAHAHEEMFVPYSADTLAARLSREPRAYSWPHLRIGERAVLGVWPAHLNVIRTSNGVTTTDDRALVLDYGYEEGAEDELLALLAAECAASAEAGSTELAIFTCEQSSAYSRLSALAKRIEPYMLHISPPPPEDLTERGIYVDQLYF